VLAVIHQYVHERVPHRPRGGERPRVVPVAPDGAAPTEGAVDRPRHPDGKPPEAAAEHSRVIGLDDEMEMVVLDTELEEPEPTVGRRSKRAADGWEDPVGPQAADGPPAAERDVHGVRGTVRGPGAVRDARAATRRPFAAGTGPTAAPGARGRER
jgi:hypothetical protein